MQLLSVYLLILAAMSGVLCSDPDPLQDLCVANYSSGIHINGYACKAAEDVTAEDFYHELGPGGVPNDTFRVVGNWATVVEVPGLNTLGIAMARLDFLPGGQVPIHTHPRATEAWVVLEGEVDITFVTTSNVVMTKTVKKGGIYFSPRGLLHYLKNNTNKTAVTLATFNSQLPGTQDIASIPKWL